MRIRPLSTNGSFVEFAPRHIVNSTFSHTFCGEHDIEGAYCPNCKKPLLRLLSLDTSDPLVGWPGAEGILPLLFCWTCNIAQQPFCYTWFQSGAVRLDRFGSGGASLGFPYAQYPICFPMVEARLVPIERQQQDLIRGINSGEVDLTDAYETSLDIAKPRHQVGGEPYMVTAWENRHPTPICCHCEADMQFLASMADYCLDPRGFTGDEFVQLLYFVCTECRAIEAAQHYS
jgi:hypothetical protein